MKAIFVESSLPNVSKNFVLKNIGILSDKYMSLIRETLKYCLADLFRKWGEGGRALGTPQICQNYCPQGGGGMVLIWQKKIHRTVFECFPNTLSHSICLGILIFTDGTHIQPGQWLWTQSKMVYSKKGKSLRKIQQLKFGSMLYLGWGSESAHFKLIQVTSW